MPAASKTRQQWQQPLLLMAKYCQIHNGLCLRPLSLSLWRKSPRWRLLLLLLGCKFKRQAEKRDFAFNSRVERRLPFCLRAPGGSIFMLRATIIVCEISVRRAHSAACRIKWIKRSSERFSLTRLHGVRSGRHKVCVQPQHQTLSPNNYFCSSQIHKRPNDIYAIARAALNNDLQLGETATGKHACASSIKRWFKENCLSRISKLY